MEFKDLFGADTLKKVASGSPQDPPVDHNFKAASQSDVQRNADYAAKRLAKPAPASKGKSPLASPMTPQGSAPAAPAPMKGTISNY